MLGKSEGMMAKSLELPAAVIVPIRSRSVKLRTFMSFSRFEDGIGGRHGVFNAIEAPW